MKNFLRFFVLMILMVFPVPLVMGQGFIHDTPLKVFLGLALLIPLILLSVGGIQKSLEVKIHRGLLFYSWVFWTVFFALGTITVPYNPEAWAFWIVHIALLLLYLFIYMVSAFGLTAWFHRKQKPIWSKVIDMSIFAFPLPVVLMGRIFYDEIPPEVAMLAFTAIYQLIYLLVLLMVALTMASIVFSMMPSTQYHHKTVRILQIFITAMIWLGVNVYVIWGYLPQFIVDSIKYVMPLFVNSPLVYITPLIFEMSILAIAVYAGYGFEKLVFSKMNTQKKEDEPIEW